MFKKVTEQDICALIEITDAGRVLTRPSISEDYSHDELGGVRSWPEVLVRVKEVREISGVMAYVCAHDIPVVVRGSGTGLVGASVALNGGIMLETLGMNRIRYNGLGRRT